MKHLIQLWPSDWVNQMAKMNEIVGMKNRLMMSGGKKRLVVRLEGKSYGNVLVAFYQQLPMGRKVTIFGVKYQNVLVRSHQLNYKQMFVEHRFK